MLNIITMNRNRGRFLSWFLYIIGTALGFVINYTLIESLTFDINLLLLLSFISIFIVHESVHFITYRFIGGVNTIDLKFTKNRRFDIPYTKTVVPVNRNRLIIVLISPSIVTSLLMLSMNIITANVAYSFLFGISFAMSGADLDVAFQLSKGQLKLWRSLDTNFGFISESN